jgi:hypothetical protein
MVCLSGDKRLVATVLLVCVLLRLQRHEHTWPMLQEHAQSFPHTEDRTDAVDVHCCTSDHTVTRIVVHILRKASVVCCVGVDLLLKGMQQ